MLSQQLSKEEQHLLKWLPDQSEWLLNQIIEGMFCSFYHPLNKQLIVVEDDAHDHPDAYTYREVLEMELAAKSYRLIFFSAWEISHNPVLVKEKLGAFLGNL